MRNKEAGFTLIELLVVVIMIGVIMSFTTSSLRFFLERSREGEGYNLIRIGLKAVYLHYRGGSAWPGSLSETEAPLASVKYWGPLAIEATNQTGAQKPTPPSGPVLNDVNIALRVLSLGQGGNHKIRGWVDDKGTVLLEVDRPDGRLDNWQTVG